MILELSPNVYISLPDKELTHNASVFLPCVEPEPILEQLRYNLGVRKQFKWREEIREGKFGIRVVFIDPLVPP